MHETDETVVANIKTALHSLIQGDICDDIVDDATTTFDIDIDYWNAERMNSSIAESLSTLQRRRRTQNHYNHVVVLVASILVVLLQVNIHHEALSTIRLLPVDAAFVTSSVGSDRSVRNSLRPAFHSAHPRDAARSSFQNMVVSDPTESTSDTMTATTITTTVPALPGMPLQPSEDGIYALTTPDDHTALMQYAEQHQQLVIVKVFAPWCRACKGLESKFIQISRETEYAPSANLPIIYASLSIQHNKAFVQSLGVLALPTIQFYVAGQLIDTFPCGPSKVPILRRKLTQLIHDHVDVTLGTLKEGSMEQVAVLAEETAASIAAAAAKRQSTSSTTTDTDVDGEANVAVKTSTTSSSSTTESDDDMETAPPVMITAQDRSTFEKIPYFKGISLADFDQVLAKVVPLTFQPGSIIVREGKPGRTFYVIKEGEMEICQKTNQRRNIESIVTSDPLVQPSVVSPSNNLYIGTVVNRLGPGDFFGERALITGEPRAASLRVAESGPVTVWAFDKDTFPHSCVLSGKSRNTGVLSSRDNTQFMDQVNTKYGVGLNITDNTPLDDTDEANLQQIIDEYQQFVMDKQLYEVSTASQIRGSIHKPLPLPETDVDIDGTIERSRPWTTPAEIIPSTPESITGDSNDAIFSLLSRFQMIRHVSRCFRYIQESKTMLKWGDSGSRTRRNMLVQRLSKSRQLEYQDIFHIMDINKDGCIEVYELQILMDSIGEPLTVQETMLAGASDCYDSGTTASVTANADTCVSQGGMTYEDFMGLMAEAEFYYLFRDIFASLDVEDSGYVKARDLDRILCGVRDLISDDRKSIIDVEDKDMLIDYEQFSRMLLGTTLL